MDIYCRVCSEPVDMDYLHEVASEQGSTFRGVYAAFRRAGCEGLGERHNSTGTPNEIAGEIQDLLGDDVDGAAAMLEDMAGWAL